MAESLKERFHSAFPLLHITPSPAWQNDTFETSSQTCPISHSWEGYKLKGRHLFKTWFCLCKLCGLEQLLSLWVSVALCDNRPSMKGWTCFLTCRSQSALALAAMPLMSSWWTWVGPLSFPEWKKNAFSWGTVSSSVSSIQTEHLHLVLLVC